MNRNPIFAITFVFLALFLGLVVGECQGEKKVAGKCDTVTFIDTVYKRDTLVVRQPKLITRETVKHDTIITRHNDTITLPVEASVYLDTIVSDGDTAIAQTHISGIKARLDSIHLQLYKRNISTNTIITVKEQPKRKLKARFGPTVGGGYGLVNGKWDVYVGVGGTLSF